MASDAVEWMRRVAGGEPATGRDGRLPRLNPGPGDMNGSAATLSSATAVAADTASTAATAARAAAAAASSAAAGVAPARDFAQDAAARAAAAAGRAASTAPAPATPAEQDWPGRTASTPTLPFLPPSAPASAATTRAPLPDTALGTAAPLAPVAPVAPALAAASAGMSVVCLTLPIPAGGSEDAHDFYALVLGLRRTSGTAVSFSCGNVELRLVEQAAFRAARGAWVTFSVSDVRGTADRLARAGALVSWTDDTRRGFVTADWHGNRVEITGQ